MKRMALGLATICLIAAPAVGDASSARSVKACPDNSVCVWSKKNFRGDREVVDRKGVTNLSRRLNNEVSSVKNTRSFTTYIFDKRSAPGSSDYTCVGQDTNYSDLAGIGFNDVVSSVDVPKPADPKRVC